MRLEMAKVLLVEDNLGDARLTKEAFSDGKVKVDLIHVEDGTDAMKFLRKQDEFSDSPIPDLILLDLNLPKMGGFDVLKEMKKSPQLSMIPVVVLTSSADEKDIVASYGLNVNCYITKPVDFDTFVDVVMAVDEFWFSIVKLPNYKSC